LKINKIKEGKMKKKKDDFVEWLKSEILSAIPAKMFKVYINPESRMVFYEMVCNHACLRPESEDVQRAFKELCREV